jgi:CheY-like chemotaxis protein
MDHSNAINEVWLTQQKLKMKSGRKTHYCITAGTEKEEKDKCINAGMSDYILKPIIKGIIEQTFIKWIHLENCKLQF